jgi:VCBS repeat-containing protein
MAIFAGEIQASTYKINAGNSAPMANDDSYDMQEDGVLQINIADLLGNDDDPDKDSLTLVLADGSNSQTTSGSLTLSSDGEYFTYAPVKEFHGADSFYYYANDGTANSVNYGIVSITVGAVNDAPITANDTYSTDTDTAIAVEVPGVLSNDTDADKGCDGEYPGDPDDANFVSAEKVTDPAHGTLTFNANGSFTYTPELGYHGVDSFTYKAKDAVANSNLATVRITVGTPNTEPVAAIDSYSTNKNTAFVIAAPGILSNDSDVDGNTLTAMKESDPAHGTLTLNADGSFAYTPTRGYTGADSFTYKAYDGMAESSETSVNITVNVLADGSGGGGSGGSSPATTLSAPKNLKATPGESSINLTWDKVSGAKGYLVYRKDQSSAFAKLTTSSLSLNAYDDTNVKTGATYTYYVVAIDDDCNEGNDSNQVTASLSSVLGEKQLNFKDVSGDSWYADYIFNLLNKQIIAGYPDNTFRPEAHVSRAEFAKMFCLAKGWAKASSAKVRSASFSDVSDADWFKVYVVAAGEHGSITGYPDGSFKGLANITRAEIAAIIARTNGLKSGTGNLSDIKGSWAKDSINACAEAGIIGGYTDGTFKPENPATRAEVSKIIDKIIKQ